MEGGIFADELCDVVEKIEHFKNQNFVLLNIVSTNKQANFRMMLWCLWRRGSTKVWKDTSCLAKHVVAQAKKTLVAWGNASLRIHEAVVKNFTVVTNEKKTIFTRTSNVKLMGWSLCTAVKRCSHAVNKSVSFNLDQTISFKS